MTSRTIDEEIDRNYDAFRRQVGQLFDRHAGQIALMQNGAIVAFFSSVSEAEREANRRFPDGLFSLQPVIEEPVDLGYFSHAGG